MLMIHTTFKPEESEEAMDRLEQCIEDIRKWMASHYLKLNDSKTEFMIQAIDDPSSNQFRDPPTYTHQPSMQQKVPFSLIRCSSSKVAFCSCVE